MGQYLARYMLEKHCKIESMGVIKAHKAVWNKNKYIYDFHRSLSIMAPRMSIFPTKNPLIEDWLFFGWDHLFSAYKIFGKTDISYRLMRTRM